MTTLEQLVFDNSYARLPESFYARVEPTVLGKPELISFNHVAAELIGLDANHAHRTDIADYLSGRSLLPQSEPIAAVYAGHQFGVYVPRLGDGRAILLGEVVNSKQQRWDLQLKGAGPTPYSRMGDGYAVLRSSIREYLCSEAMHGLGIPSTRALALIGTDQTVYREVAETGAILLRMAPTHVRFGSFEYFSHTRQYDLLATLADYVIQHHFPHLLNQTDKYEQWFSEIVQSTAHLIAQWQSCGFTHGVMNTDNMSILGLTIDYGPFGFIDAYQPDFNCNHSDHHGRYRFNQQPNIALWNLACLAQALLPIISEAPLRQCLEQYRDIYQARYHELMLAKLGLCEKHEGDIDLLQDWLQLMAQSGADYTNTMRALSEFQVGASNAGLRDRFVQPQQFNAWAKRYGERLYLETSTAEERKATMNRVNPKYILRNYLLQIAIEQAQQGDYAEIERLLGLLRDPYQAQMGCEHYAAEPPEWSRSLQLSCSS